ncbi:MAG TPA: hypothetical protein VIG06_02070 [Kofleriaceae bacterium]
MRALFAAPVLLVACLDAPPGSIADGGAAASDGAAGGHDAEPISCPGSLGLALTSEGDLAGWTPDNGPSCSSAVTGAGLEFSNSGMPSSCRLYRDQVLDMRGGNLLVRLNDAAPDLAMSISVVLGPPELDFNDRRWLYFERDGGQLLFGECLPGAGCSDTTWGSIVYSPVSHIWLRFTHQRETDLLLFETSDDTVEWELQSAAENVTNEDLYCIGVDLGSYEQQTSGETTTSSFSDLSGGPPPAVTRP